MESGYFWMRPAMRLGRLFLTSKYHTYKDVSKIDKMGLEIFHIALPAIKEDVQGLAPAGLLTLGLILGK